MKLSKVLSGVKEKQLKPNVPDVQVGDLVRVGIFIKEGDKQRIQNFEGTVIAKHNASLTSNITVRKTFQGVGVERVFPLHSPLVQNIDILRRSKVRRAKLFYLRERVGKATRLKEKFR
nr:Ribosomal protein L19 [Pedinophyceae sp. YPF-701]